MRALDFGVARKPLNRPLVVIGIHGLANKPPQDEKKKWWLEAIREGLRRNCGQDGAAFKFEFVYWADLRYDDPLKSDDNLEPYSPDDGDGPFPHHDPADESLWLKLSNAVCKKVGDIESAINSNIVDDIVLEYQFDDLWFYHENNEFCRKARKRLQNKLDEYKDHRIMIVAHSMGSVIAYDCLSLADGGRDRASVHHLVTMGSPLGLNAIVDKISEEHGGARVPNAVAEWTNLCDKGDVVAVASRLSENYKPNDLGVQVRDRIVENGYRRPDGVENRHKSYGYLRTPEFSEAVRQFMADGATSTSPQNATQAGS